MNRGAWYAVSAYIIWGLLPVYWKGLQGTPAPQLLGHRIVWSCLMLAGVLLVTRRWRDFCAVLTPRVLALYSVAALLIGVNWLTYVWAVNGGYIVETSLGYFINPLVSVLLGVLFLRERLRPLQWLPVALAASGVLYLSLTYGALPWIALTLALSFACYALVKKLAPLGSVYGLTLETGLLLLPALLYLLYADRAGQGVFLHGGLAADALLAGAGVATTVPLLLFASAAQRIPLSLIGILQYIAPTLQLLLGVLVYHEPFTRSQQIGFGAVWAALALYGLEGLYAQRARQLAEVGA